MKKYERVGSDHIGSIGSDFKDPKNLRFRYLDTNTGKIIAFKSLKLQPDASCGDSDDEKETGVPCTAVREVSLMKAMEHENIARLHDLDYETGDGAVRVIFEYPGINLTNFIEKEPEKASDPMLVKKHLYQLLRGIFYYHSVNAAHGGLNSTNVLIDSTNDSLKIINLELVTKAAAKHPNKAPELLLGSTDVSLAADMFSLGCIFGEMVTKKPLFSSGDDDVQLRSIFNLLGTPTEKNWPGANELYQRLSEYEKIDPKDLKEVVPSLDEDGIDLLSKLLALDPSKRIAAADALKHPYFKDVRA